jgi:oligopeptide/dipeptide ABC transporter ATP-binding protein
MQFTHPSSSDSILQVDSLHISFSTNEGRIDVLEDISFFIGSGEIVGLVGESGCGKSVTAMAIMRLNPSPPSSVESGRIFFKGNDILSLDEGSMRHIRGNRIGMIFQEPMTSLNPTFTIGYQVAEVFRCHLGLSQNEANNKTVEMLDLVGIGGAQRRMEQYPHELSGGLRQRVMIAIALACRPELLIADEPTTALDVTVQAQILDLLRTLQSEMNMSVLLISHDLGIVAETCDRVFVMYAGRIVEKASVVELFQNPLHPYTTGLMSSSPRLGQSKKRLPMIPGMVPSPSQRGTGCYFTDRCSKASEYCRHNTPTLEAVGDKHQVACWNYK